MTLMNFLSIRFLIFTITISVIISLSNKYPPCCRVRFHYSISLHHTIKIMKNLLSVSIMTMYSATCLVQKSCRNVSLLKVICDVLWCLQSLVETLRHDFCDDMSFLNKSNFLMSRNKSINIFHE